MFKINQATYKLEVKLVTFNEGADYFEINENQLKEWFGEDLKRVETLDIARAIYLSYHQGRDAEFIKDNLHLIEAYKGKFRQYLRHRYGIKGVIGYITSYRMINWVAKLLISDESYAFIVIDGTQYVTSFIDEDDE